VSLKFERILVGAEFPVRVMAAAFKWGRNVEPKVRFAGPVTQKFFNQ
jgi:hypothetical protein